MMVARSLERSRPSLSMAGMSITSPVGNLAVELGVSSLVVQSTGSGRGAARSRGALHRRGVHGGGVGGLDAGAGVSVGSMLVLGLVVGPAAAGWAACCGVMVAGRCNPMPGGPRVVWAWVASWGLGSGVAARSCVPAPGLGAGGSGSKA